MGWNWGIGKSGEWAWEGDLKPETEVEGDVAARYSRTCMMVHGREHFHERSPQKEWRGILERSEVRWHRRSR